MLWLLESTEFGFYGATSFKVTIGLGFVSFFLSFIFSDSAVRFLFGCICAEFVMFCFV